MFRVSLLKGTGWFHGANRLQRLLQTLKTLGSTAFLVSWLVPTCYGVLSIYRRYDYDASSGSGYSVDTMARPAWTMPLRVVTQSAHAGIRTFT